MTLQSWALAQVTDLAERVGPITGTEDVARAESAITDVSAMVLLEGEDDWIAETVPPAVFSVVLAAARRLYINPDYTTSSTEGSFTEQRRTAAVGEILAEPEVRIVRRSRRNRSTLFTQRITRGEREADDTVYVPDSSGTPFPVDTRGQYGQ